MAQVEMLDLTLPFSVQTPQWANYEPLSVKYTKRVGGLDFGLGRNNAHCRASFHLATHMDGEKHFWAAGRTIGEMPLEYWHGPGVIVDISDDGQRLERLHPGHDRGEGRSAGRRHPVDPDRLATATAGTARTRTSFAT